MDSVRNTLPPGNPGGEAATSAVALAVSILGAAIVPTKRALAAAGLNISDSAVHEARAAGRLPVKEETFGGARYFVTAGAFARAFLMPPAQAPTAAAVNGEPAALAAPARRGPGRPRKHPRPPQMLEGEQEVRNG